MSIPYLGPHILISSENLSLNCASAIQELPMSVLVEIGQFYPAPSKFSPDDFRNLSPVFLYVC